MGYIRRLLPILISFQLLYVPPNKHAVELFAGERQVSKNLLLMGYVVQSFDELINKHHNFLTDSGFIVSVVAVMTTCMYGVIWLAPPCSSWVWLSRYSTGRHLHVLGDLLNIKVQEQNKLVGRLCYIIILAIKRQIYFIIEQPAKSIMWEHPRLKAILQKYKEPPRTYRIL